MPRQIYNKEQILDKCLEVFAKNGYKNTSTLMLAEAAGISKALIFHHYKNKKKLYLAIVEHCIEKASGEISTEEILKDEKDFFKTLEKTNSIKIDYIQKNPNVYALVKEAFYATPVDLKTEIEEKYSSIIANEYKIWEKLFENVKLKDEINRKKAFELIMITLEHFRDIFLAQTMNSTNLDMKYLQNFNDKMFNFINMIQYGIMKIEGESNNDNSK